MPAARTATQPTPPQAAWALPVATLVVASISAVVALWYSWPAAIVLWAGVLASGFMTQAPTYTGPVDSSKRPTAANGAESEGMRRHLFYRQLAWRPLIPTWDWAPFDPATETPDRARQAPWYLKVPLAATATRLTFALAVCAGIAAATQPLDERAADLAPLNGLAAFVVVAQLTASSRRAAHAMYPRPAVQVVHLVALGAEHRQRVVRLLLGGGALGVVVTLVTLWYTPSSYDHRLVLSVVVGVSVMLLVVRAGLRNQVASQWRDLVDTADAWIPRWSMMKRDPAPTLISHEVVGHATVDTFRAPATTGAADYWTPKSREQITNALGAGVALDVLACLNTDSTGQPIPDQVHPHELRLVTWQTGGEVDVAAADTDPALVRLMVEHTVVTVADAMKLPRPMLSDVAPITDTTGAEPADEQPDQPTARLAYLAAFTFPDGGSYRDLQSAQGGLAQVLGVPVMVDARRGELFFGDLEAVTGDRAGQLEDLLLESHWNGVWAAAIKQNMKPPVVQPRVHRVAELADGTEVHFRPFAVGKGQDPLDYYGYEVGLATASGQKFMTTTGFCMPSRTSRPGDRENLALTLVHSARAVPTSPQALAPARRGGPQANLAQRWVLTGMVNAAFDASRLARPEVVDVAALTHPRSSDHIWSVTLRLYGGVTTPQVRAKSQVFAQTWGAPWLRLGPGDGDTITLYAGAKPSEVRLADANRIEKLVTSLDWEQAWVDAKVVNRVTGAVPVLREASRMPMNDTVQVLDFELPQGVSVAQARAATGRLQTSTGNLFLEFRPGVLGASSVRVLACPESPMPSLVPYDFNYRDPKGAMPFATQVDGGYATIDLKDIPHLLMLGTSGSGKSAAAQGLVTSALSTGAKVAIIDVQKRGADFTFARDRTIAFATSVVESAATMRALYAEVQRRADLNAEHGAGSVRDLPEDVRPEPICVFIDEFLGVIMAGTKPPRQPEDDPEREAQRVEQMEMYNAKKDIGFLAGRIAAEARSADVHLVLMTQKLTTTSLDDQLRDLKTNMGRILLGKANQGERMSGLRDPENAPDPGQDVPKGRGVWESTMAPAELVQFWYASTTEYRAHLENAVAPPGEADLLDIAPFMPQRESFGVVDEADDLAPATADDEVIERQAEEFSLEDLLALTDDGSGQPAPTQSEADDDSTPADTPHSTPTPELVDEPDPTGTLVVLDAPDDGPDGALVGRLATLAHPMVWAGEVGAAHRANELTGRATPVAPSTQDSQHGWWKLDALERLANDRAVERIVWLDALAHDESDLGITHAEYATDLLEACGVELVAPRVDPSTGLVAADLACVTDEVAAVAPAKPAVAAAAGEHDVAPTDVDDFAADPPGPPRGATPAEDPFAPDEDTVDDDPFADEDATPSAAPASRTRAVDDWDMATG
ncbi:FtsK/SpoIIIE domain-containing protein [Isoptericola croceus]|uniref:FtsK/SpoIIIE domain-containing protein n=1 Tax=Isoptericola croceus TaxID=3031406 RepID=UPI0023F6E146|nr:FtsK/SpoIIIE domain-containing protein [Isoptericola croceus]